MGRRTGMPGRVVFYASETIKRIAGIWGEDDDPWSRGKPSAGVVVLQAMTADAGGCNGDGDGAGMA